MVARRCCRARQPAPQQKRSGISYFPSHGFMMATVPSFAAIEPDNGALVKLVGSQTKWFGREQRQRATPARQERRNRCRIDKIRPARALGRLQSAHGTGG